MSSSSSPVREGDILAGKYRVDRVLGEGGMGVVVAATHLVLDEKVALKFLLPAIAKSEEFVARFLREARASAKIRSEHVARVTDVGTLENGAPYLVMEYLDGQDLGARLEHGGPLPVRDAVDCVLQACEALAEAHAIGIVHRDLKPANLFLTHRADATPSVKVLDFGISKMAMGGEPDAALTKTSGVMGSPLYMSPEQLQSSKDVDARTDVWSLGVILYELLAGRQPFSAESMPQLVVQVMTMPPRPLADTRPEVPPGLVAAIEHALQKDRALRLPDVAAFAAAVAPFGGSRATDSADRVARVLESKGRRRVPQVAPGPVEEPLATAATMQMTTGGVGSVTADTPVSVGPVLPKPLYARPLAVGAAVLLLAAGGFALATVITGPSASSPTTAAHDPPPADSLPRQSAGGANDPAPHATQLPSGANASASAVTPAPVPSTRPAPIDAQAPASLPAHGEQRPAGRSALSAPPVGGTGTPSATAPARPTPATPNCDPPFFIDPATGTRKVKPGC